MHSQVGVAHPGDSEPKKGEEDIPMERGRGHLECEVLSRVGKEITWGCWGGPELGFRA